MKAFSRQNPKAIDCILPEGLERAEDMVLASGFAGEGISAKPAAGFCFRRMRIEATLAKLACAHFEVVLQLVVEVGLQTVREQGAKLKFPSHTIMRSEVPSTPPY